MDYHIKMLVLYIQSITISTALITELGDTGDKPLLTQALDNRDYTWEQLASHLAFIVRNKHRHASVYVRIVDQLICN